MQYLSEERSHSTPSLKRPWQPSRDRSLSSLKPSSMRSLNSSLSESSFSFVAGAPSGAEDDNQWEFNSSRNSLLLQADGASRPFLGHSSQQQLMSASSVRSLQASLSFEGDLGFTSAENDDIQIPLQQVDTGTGGSGSRRQASHPDRRQMLTVSSSFNGLTSSFSRTSIGGRGFENDVAFTNPKSDDIQVPLHTLQVGGEVRNASKKPRSSRQNRRNLLNLNFSASLSAPSFNGLLGASHRGGMALMNETEGDGAHDDKGRSRGLQPALMRNASWNGLVANSQRNLVLGNSQRNLFLNKKAVGAVDGTSKDESDNNKDNFRRRMMKHTSSVRELLKSSQRGEVKLANDKSDALENNNDKDDEKEQVERGVPSQVDTSEEFSMEDEERLHQSIPREICVQPGNEDLEDYNTYSFTANARRQGPAATMRCSTSSSRAAHHRVYGKKSQSPSASNTRKRNTSRSNNSLGASNHSTRSRRSGESLRSNGSSRPPLSGRQNATWDTAPAASGSASGTRRSNIRTAAAAAALLELTNDSSKSPARR